MPTVTKTFAFAADAEGFVAAQVAASRSLTYDAAVGNPAGSLKASTATKSLASAESYWEWAGTWEALGVPAGGVVTSVRLLSASTRVATRSAHVTSSIVGPYRLHSDAGALIGTLWAGRTAVAAEAGWTATGAQAAVAVPSHASTDVVRVRLADTNATTSGGGTAALAMHDDQVAIEVTYTAPAPSLAVDPLTVGPSIEGPALTQVHALAVDALTVGPVAEAAGVTTESTLAPAGMTVGPVVEAGALTTVTDLAVDALTVTPTAAAVGVTTELSLAPASLTVAPTADGAALTQVHNLAVDPVVVAPTSAAAGITTESTLAPADLLVAPTAAAGSLTQVHQLAAADLTVAPLVAAATPSSESTLAVADLAVAPVLDAPAPTQVHALQVAPLQVAPVLEPAGITTPAILAPADLVIGPALDGAALATASDLEVGPLMLLASFSEVALLLGGAELDVVDVRLAGLEVVAVVHNCARTTRATLTRLDVVDVDLIREA